MPAFLFACIYAPIRYIACVADSYTNWPLPKGNRMEPLIKAKELAEKLSVNVETVRRWTRAGIIPHVVVGQSKRYSLTEVMSELREIDH